MAATMSVNGNEPRNLSSMMRATKEGKKLTYEMTVIQQPERARACGSGAKSSADRRPVDPPPVVELRIFEGEGAARNDITFSYNANFFLYTTLESARPIVHGRVPAVPPTFPVLTGMPVAGMAYLDRPSPAGYFIFPDLSVRHEGKYRLSFNLYEELKESKDADLEPAATSPDHPNNQVMKANPTAPQMHVHFRLEIKSDPFVVFSAKKFPGLAESTSLSRVVAEQGCRVRIRRDVRMRRRDPKSNKDFDDFDEEGTFSRTERYATPDVYSQSHMGDRPRSASHASAEIGVPYGVEPRRMSTQDSAFYSQPVYQQAPPPAPAPPLQNSSNGYNSHLSFGPSSMPQYHAPTFNSDMIPSEPQMYQQQSTSYQYQPATHARPLSSSQTFAYSPSAQYPPQNQYFSQQHYGEHGDYRPPAEYRRDSAPVTMTQNNSLHHSAQPQPQMTNPYAPADNRSAHPPLNYQPPLQRSSTPSTMMQALPPLKTLQPPPDRKYEQSSSTGMIPAMNSTALHNSLLDASDGNYGSNGNTSQPVGPNMGRPSKRPFANVFDSSHLNQPMHAGMRPSPVHYGQDVPQVETDDGQLDDVYDMPREMLLQYRRADGSKTQKKCPSPQYA